MILAGGQGTRLRPIIGCRQKVITRMGGRPFVAMLLDQLDRNGLHKAIICTGFEADAVAGTLGGTFKSMQLWYSRETRALGTAGALRHAYDRIESETVLVMNGDSYFPVDLSQVWKWHQHTAAQHTIVLAHVPDVKRYGQVSLDAGSRITRFAEKGVGQGPGWINAGIYLLRRDCIGSIPEAQAVSIERDIFPRLVEQGLHGYKGDADFIDIGTPQSFRQAQTIFCQNPSDAGVRNCDLQLDIIDP
jgi:NDP-sugar pyrophosphorylase family protein